MTRSIIILASIWLTAGCATGPTVLPTEQEPQDPAVVMAILAPSLLQGQPLTNAELASYLAEYELTRRGVDCRENQMTVSYCDGVYTVAFLEDDQRSLVEKYIVELNANDSTILRMTKMQRVASTPQTASSPS